MTDPFTQDPPTPGEDVIKVGDKVFSQGELNNLISLGAKAQELEKNHGAIEKFVSEWGRKNDELGKLREELEEVKKSASAPKPAVSTEFTEEQRVLAQKQIADIMGGQPVTDKQLDTWFEAKYTQRKSAEKLLDELSELEGQIDGTDGRPKFDSKEILDFMATNGTKKPMIAYKELHGDKLDEWSQKELLKAKPKGFYTEERASAIKQPPAVKITKDNLNQMVREQLYGAQE